MTTFTVPIQERDQVQLQAPDVPTLRKQITDRVPSGIEKPIDELARQADAQAKQIRIQTHQFAKTKFENDRDATIDANLNEVMSAKGQNAFIEADRAKQTIQDQTSKMLQQYPAEYQQEFSNLADQGMNRFNKTALGHAYTEQNNLKKSAAKLRAEYTTNQMALNPYDPDTWQQNKQDLMDITEAETRRVLGVNPDLNVKPSPEAQDAINIQKQSANSHAITQTILMQASNEDIQGAEAFSKKYESELTSNDKMKINAALAKGRGDQSLTVAKTLSQQAIDLSPNDLYQALNHAKAMTTDGKVFSHTESFIRQDFAAKEIQRKQDGEKSLAAAYTEADKNGSLSLPTLKRLQPEDRAKAQAYLVAATEGQHVPLNPVVYNKLTDLMMNDPETFKDTSKTNLMAYKGDMPKEYFNHFVAEQKSMQDPTVSRYSAQTADNMVRQRTQAELAGKYKTTDKDYIDKLAENRLINTKVVDIIKAKDTNGRMSSAEFQKAWDEEYTLQKMGHEEVYHWWRPNEPAVQPQTKAFDQYDPIDKEQMQQKLTKYLGRTPSPSETVNALKEASKRGYIKPIK